MIGTALQGESHLLQALKNLLYLSKLTNKKQSRMFGSSEFLLIVLAILIIAVPFFQRRSAARRKENAHADAKTVEYEEVQE